MKVLVTGAGGFVGWNLSQYLERRGFKVLRLDLREEAEIRADVSDLQGLWSALEGEDFDAVVHLAAIANIPKSLEDPYLCFKVNSLGTLNMLEVSLRKGVRRFLYASSANVYGVPVELPVRETTPFNPRTPYDYSKVASEAMVESYHKAKGLPTVVFRAWKLFGERDVPTTAIPRFIRACLRGEPIQLYNAGRDTTDPTYIENYCYAVELALTRGEAVGEKFNVGTGNEVSIRELAEMIRRLTGSETEIRLLPPRTEAEKEPMRSYPSIEKLEQVLGYRPKVSLEEGLKRTIEYYRRLEESKTFL